MWYDAPMMDFAHKTIASEDRRRAPVLAVLRRMAPAYGLPPSAAEQAMEIMDDAFADAVQREPLGHRHWED